MRFFKTYDTDGQETSPNPSKRVEHEQKEIDNKMTAEEYYQQGNDLRRRGDYQAAMNAYMEAIALDADSPAVEALRMLQDIMNFYHKDSYNP